MNNSKFALLLILLPVIFCGHKANLNVARDMNFEELAVDTFILSNDIKSTSVHAESITTNDLTMTALYTESISNPTGEPIKVISL
jgi:hypothetical protein